MYWRLSYIMWTWKPFGLLSIFLSVYLIYINTWYYLSQLNRVFYKLILEGWDKTFEDTLFLNVPIACKWEMISGPVFYHGALESTTPFTKIFFILEDTLMIFNSPFPLRLTVKTVWISCLNLFSQVPPQFILWTYLVSSIAACHPLWTPNILSGNFNKPQNPSTTPEPFLEEYVSSPPRPRPCP